MLRRTLFAGVLTVLFLAAGHALAARSETTNGDVLARDVIAGGGGRSETSSGNVLYGTIGQPVAAVSNARNGTMLISGFHTVIPRGPTIVRTWHLY